jgi:hypothetical protein
MAAKVSTSLQNWQFQDQHVQQNLAGGDFIGSHSCIVCATAPRMADLTDGGNAFINDVANTGAGGDLTGTYAIPIGVIDTASLMQDRQIATIFEIGSKRSYIMASRTVGQLQIARVFYKGPNLLRMLYAFYPPEKLAAKTGDVAGMTLRDRESDQGTAIPQIGMDGTASSFLPTIKDNPGYGNVILNLNSDIFSQPYGIVLYMKDNNDTDVAAIFLEECYVATHSMNISANQVVVAENVSMRFERAVPIKCRVVGGRGGAGGLTGLGASNLLAGGTNVQQGVAGILAGLGG